MLSKIRRLTCPNCGAAVPTPPTDGWIRCAYCDAVSQLQGFARVGMGPTGQPASSYPIATYRVSRWVYVAPLVFTFATAGAVVMFSAIERRRADVAITRVTSAAAAGSSSDDPASWATWTMPLPCDDHHLLGWARAYTSDRPVDYLADVDLESGAGVWSQRLDADPESSLLACSGATVVLVGDHGVAYAFALADGTPRWTTPLGERAEQICDASKDAVVVALADKRWVQLALADGAMTPATPQRCSPLWSTAPSWPSSVQIATSQTHTVGDPLDLHVPGMDALRVFEDPASQQLVVIGNKAPGTAVPMAAAYACEKVALGKNFFGEREYRCNGPHERWKLAIPADDAMRAELPTPEPVAGTRDGALYVGYIAGRIAHVAAIDIGTGARRWDHALNSDDIRLILPLNDRILVTTDREIDLLDPAMGRQLAVIK